jgi:hypothetical protein
LKAKEKECDNLVTKAHHLKCHLEAFDVPGLHPRHPEGELPSKKAKGKSRAETQAPPFYIPEGTSKSMSIIIDPPSPLQDHVEDSSSQGLSSLGKCPRDETSIIEEN